MEEQPDNAQPPENAKPPRSKARLTFVIALWVVLVLLIIAIFTPARDVVINRFLTAAPTPTATMVAGDDLFNIQASPTGIVTVDGHALGRRANLSAPYYTDKPLRLSRGQHKIVWQAAPFNPLTCIVSVPPTASEQCNYESAGTSSTAPGTRDISFIASLTDLPVAQQTALKQALQASLNTLQSTTTVQPGEQYVYSTSSSNTTMKTATQLLNATLSLHLDANPASSNSCENGFGETCSFNGQNCLQLCTSDIFGATPDAAAKLTWDIIALFYPTWTYATQSGQIIAQNQPDTNSPAAGMDHSLQFRVTWDGSAWHASANFTPETINQGQSPPECASLIDQVSSTTNYGNTQNSTHANVDWGYAVGPNEAQGCLAVVVPSAQQGTPTNFKQPPAYFLYHFGVLYAANALAHSEFPNIPQADVNEQSIAQHIAGKLKLS